LFISSNSSDIIYIKLISTANFDDMVEVTLDNNGIPPAYAANLSWFNRTTMLVRVPKGETILIPFEVSIPSGVSGYKVFHDNAISQGLGTTSMDTGVIYVS